MVRAWIVAMAGMLAAGQLAGCGPAAQLAGSGARATDLRSASSCPASARGLGLFAFVMGEELRVLDFADCRVRRPVEVGAEPPVRFSGDGRWLAFGSGVVVPADGGPATRPLGAPVGAWRWAPQAPLLAGVTQRRGVVIGGPSERPRQLLADGWGAESLAFDHSGSRLAVARTPAAKPAATRPQEIWIVHTVSGRRSRAVRLIGGLAPPLVAGWSPDDRWVLFWRRTQNSASLQADGLPLYAAPAAGGRTRRIAVTLTYDDFLTDCVKRLLLVAGPIRTATTSKRLAIAGPPAWRPRTLAPDRARAWSSPACSSDGRRIVAPAGPNIPGAAAAEAPRRALWLLYADHGPIRRLTDPPRLASDELPRLSRDGRAVVFVRATRRRRVELPRGALHVRVDGRTSGPLTDLGRGSLYYNHDNWAAATDWHQPPQ